MILLLTNVNTTIRLGGTGVDLTSASSVQQLISLTMTSIHYLALAIALCIFLTAIVRQYTQFAEHMGVRFIGSLLVVLVMIFSFPKICNTVQNATYSYSQGTATTMENMFCWLTEQKPYAGKESIQNQSIVKKLAHLPENTMHSIQSAMCNIFYINGIYLGKGVRDIVYFIFKCLYNGALCLTPIFFAAMLIPETKHLGVNFIVTCIGMALMPVCFLFGDICNIWLTEHMWSTLGLGSNGTFWIIARSGQMMINPVGTVLGYIAFGIFYALLAAVVYVVLPFLYMKLFRNGTPGSPAGLMASMIGKALNTAIVSGAMIATAGAAAPVVGAAGTATVGGNSGTAAQAARNAAKSTITAGNSGGSSAPVASEIDSAANASPGK